MYTYVQRPGCKKENTATYVYKRAGLERLLAHTYGQGSCTWLGRNGETASSSCSWGGNGMRRIHGEATECVVFIGRQRNVSCSSGGNETRGSQLAWTEQAMETRPGVLQNGGNGLVFDRPRSKRDLFIGRGLAYRKMEETDLLRSKWGSCSSGGVWRTTKQRKRTSYGRNGGPVDREGCVVPQNG